MKHFAFLALITLSQSVFAKSQYICVPKQPTKRFTQVVISEFGDGPLDMAKTCRLTLTSIDALGKQIQSTSVAKHNAGYADEYEGGGLTYFEFNSNYTIGIYTTGIYFLPPFDVKTNGFYRIGEGSFPLNCNEISVQ